MRKLWERFRAWREARRLRYAERWASTQPYDSRADKYLPPTGGGADSLPPTSGN